MLYRSNNDRPQSPGIRFVHEALHSKHTPLIISLYPYILRASCSHICASVTKQYNLVLSGWEGNREAWQKVMAAYSRVYDFVTCGLTAYDRDQLQTQRSYMSMGYLYFYLLYSYYLIRPLRLDNGHVIVCILYTAENIFDDISYNACNSRHGAFAAFFEFVPYK